MLHTTAKHDLIFHIEKSFYIEGEQKGMLWRNQTKTVRQQFVAQAEQILRAIQENRPVLEFSLPEKVILIDPFTHAYREEPVPVRHRRQTIRRRFFRRGRSILSDVLQRLSDLQSSSYLSLSLSANILRYWIARLWLNQIPEGEPFPQSPSPQSPSATTVEPRRGFPEWLLFDTKGDPLFSTPEEVEQRIRAIKSALQSLLSVMAIDPSIVEEEAFRSRYTALVTQWTEQGRLYSEHLTKGIISTIHQRKSQHTLNRGLSIHLPYFDDQLLEIEYLDLEVVPPGRIPFEEVFLFEAVQKAKQQVSKDGKLSPTTRQHLLAELELLESSCSSCPSYLPVGVLSPYYHWVKASPSSDVLQNSSKSDG
ncbi:MAG: hypothetical protein NZ840_06595 [Anaerolineales bacterium]|nr:hypothetical protein [Anaerolineales bacterium]MDW8161706.1 hypothetical protein [Anaerolineales bacterium]